MFLKKCSASQISKTLCADALKKCEEFVLQYRAKVF